MTGFYPAGLPHSEISGSKPVSSSPKLFAAYRVLHRLPMPRHPPSALSSLTKYPKTQKNTQLLCANLQLTRYSIIKEQFRLRDGRYALQPSRCQPHTRLTASMQSATRRPPLTKMVEVNGIEPMTSCVQGRRSPS